MRNWWTNIKFQLLSQLYEFQLLSHLDTNVYPSYLFVSLYFPTAELTWAFVGPVPHVLSSSTISNSQLKVSPAFLQWPNKKSHFSIMQIGVLN